MHVKQTGIRRAKRREVKGRDREVARRGMGQP